VLLTWFANHTCLGHLATSSASASSSSRYSKRKIIPNTGLLERRERVLIQKGHGDLRKLVYHRSVYTEHLLNLDIRDAVFS